MPPVASKPTNVQAEAAARDEAVRSKRQLTQQNTGDIARKAINDNFKGPEWTPERMNSVYIEGKHLLQYIHDLIHRWRRHDPDVKRGKGMYADAKLKYRSSDNPLERLMSLVEEEEEVPEKFQRAFELT